MSVEHMNRVFEHSRSEGTARLVLLALAWYADDHGNAWPSVKNLADRANVGERQVQRVLVQLESLGEVAIDRTRGRSNTNTFRVIVGSCAAEKGVTAMSPFRTEGAEKKGDIHGRKGVTQGKKGVTQDAKGDIAMPPNRQDRQDRHLHTEGAAAPPAPPPAAIGEKRHLDAKWRALTGHKALNPAQLDAGLAVLTAYAERGDTTRFYDYMAEGARKGWRFDGFLGAARDRLDKPPEPPPARGAVGQVRSMSPPEPDEAWAEEYSRRQIAKWAAVSAAKAGTA